MEVLPCLGAFVVHNFLGPLHYTDYTEYLCNSCSCKVLEHIHNMALEGFELYLAYGNE